MPISVVVFVYSLIFSTAAAIVSRRCMSSTGCERVPELHNQPVILVSNVIFFVYIFTAIALGSAYPPNPSPRSRRLLRHYSP